MTTMTTLDNLLAGTIPATLEDKTQIAHKLKHDTPRIVPSTSILIASAKRDNFPKDTFGWTQWCKEEAGLEGSDRDHRRAIGDMLLYIQGTKLFDRLYLLGLNKLKCLTQIPDDQLEPFCSRHRVEGLDRDELRKAVHQWIGKEDKEKGNQPELPGFSSALEAICAMDEEALVSRVMDPATAQTTLKAGTGLLGASLSWYKQNPDPLLLQSLRAALLDEVKELEELLSKIPESENVLAK